MALGGGPDVQGCLALTLARAGRHDEARAALAALEAEAPRRHVSAYRLATIHLALGCRSRALALLERAVEERACPVTYLKTDPVLAPLRDDERFAALVVRAWRPGGSPPPRGRRAAPSPRMRARDRRSGSAT